jgi:hypothetical protein
MRLAHDDLVDLLSRRCALLCSKDEDVTAAFLAPRGDPFDPDPPLWCARSLTTQGPDGEQVHLSGCQPPRGCWQARPRRG